MKKVLILFAALGMLFGVVSLSASAGAQPVVQSAAHKACGPPPNPGCIQDYPNANYPYCITFIPNATGVAPDEDCWYKDNKSGYDGEVNNEEDAGARRLATEFQDIHYGEDAGGSLIRLAVLTRRPGDGSGCLLADSTPIRSTLMPKGWAANISSERTDDHYCRIAPHYTATYYGGSDWDCGSYLKDIGYRDCYNGMGFANDTVKSFKFEVS